MNIFLRYTIYTCLVIIAFTANTATADIKRRSHTQSTMYKLPRSEAPRGSTELSAVQRAKKTKAEQPSSSQPLEDIKEEKIKQETAKTQIEKPKKVKLAEEEEESHWTDIFRFDFIKSNKDKRTHMGGK